MQDHGTELENERTRLDILDRKEARIKSKLILLVKQELVLMHLMGQIDLERSFQNHLPLSLQEQYDQYEYELGRSDKRKKVYMILLARVTQEIDKVEKSKSSETAIGRYTGTSFEPAYVMGGANTS